MSTPIIPQITPKELKARMDAGEDLFLLDVREAHERDTVTQHLEKIPKDKEVVVYCRSGGRSDWIARELVGRHGYTKVSNLAGGMLRWSDDVDPSFRKY
jgi:adenylyltransferase/sulfurtransferase